MADPVRVIVVDDEPDLREMIATYLGKHGFVVAEAGHGAELDGLLNNGPPDLLILDVNLPGEDGFTSAAGARSQRRANSDADRRQRHGRWGGRAGTRSR
jgi:DNA-binding response OmpR family regulator